MSRLATVLDLESPPKLESTDCSETETLDSAALMKRTCLHACVVNHLALCADLTALRAAAAVALFAFPEHPSP